MNFSICTDYEWPKLQKALKEISHEGINRSFTMFTIALVEPWLPFSFIRELNGSNLFCWIDFPPAFLAARLFAKPLNHIWLIVYSFQLPVYFAIEHFGSQNHNTVETAIITHLLRRNKCVSNEHNIFFLKYRERYFKRLFQIHFWRFLQDFDIVQPTTIWFNLQFFIIIVMVWSHENLRRVQTGSL